MPQEKVGFTIPLEDWFRDYSKLGHMLKYLKDDLFHSRPLYDHIYDHKFVHKIIENHMNHKANYGRILWTILNVELWHRIFIDRAFDSILANQKIPIHD